MSERTWLHHAVAAGPELILATLTLLLMPYFFLVGLPGPFTHPLDSAPFPSIVLIAVLGFVGALAWLYGWWAEKRTGVADALKWDRFGASMLTLCWLAGTVVVWLVPGLPSTNGVVTLAIAGAFFTRQLATRFLSRRAVEAEVLVHKADQLLSETGELGVARHRSDDDGR